MPNSPNNINSNTQTGSRDGSPIDLTRYTITSTSTVTITVSVTPQNGATGSLSITNICPNENDYVTFNFESLVSGVSFKL